MFHRAHVLPLLALCALLCARPAAAFLIGDFAPRSQAIEFHNERLDHYVLLSDPAEIAAVEAGSAGPGWKRTGHWFRTRLDPARQPNICRFYAPGPNSHFFTGDATECRDLRENDTGWHYEGLAFFANLPVAGRCDGGIPIYRLYNDRWMFNDSNHRFIADGARRADMVAAGWVDEGIAFCASEAGHDAAATFAVETGKVLPSRECEDESSSLGPCLAYNQIPRLVNRVPSWLPPWYVTRDPLYAAEYTGLTGFDGDVHTSQPVSDANVVAAHSFAQTLDIAKGTFGIFATYRDRTTLEYSSINPLYQFVTTAPAAAEADRRVFPWRAREAELHIAFTAQLATLRRVDAASHAYGHPTLQFKNVATGRELYVTFLAFGTVEPTDLLMIDEFTNRVIVGTRWDRPSFGRLQFGSAIRCEGAAGSERCDGRVAGGRYRMTREDFQAVLERARKLDPGLTVDPTNYLLANFHFTNEIYRKAELGATISGFRVDLYGF